MDRVLKLVALVLLALFLLPMAGTLVLYHFAGAMVDPMVYRQRHAATPSWNRSAGAEALDTRHNVEPPCNRAPFPPNG
jgi:hypothetical protein